MRVTFVDIDDEILFETASLRDNRRAIERESERARECTEAVTA
jgi:hypothetical protein